MEEQDTNVCVTVVFLIKDVLCVAVGPREEGEVVDYMWLECLLGRLSQTLRCRKVKDVKKATKPHFESLWAALIPVNFLVCLASQLSSVEGFLFELKWGMLQCIFFYCRDLLVTLVYLCESPFHILPFCLSVFGGLFITALCFLL